MMILTLEGPPLGDNRMTYFCYKIFIKASLALETYVFRIEIINIKKKI